jgi:glutaminyl-peptide cyclotransferase
VKTLTIGYGFLALLLSLTAQAGPVQYQYKVVNQKPQPRDHFVQGLQIVDNELYVSTGRYGRSSIMRFHFDSGKLQKGFRLNPALWGEGLTVLGDEVFQLTWKAGMLLVYQRDQLKYSHRFALPGQGWGITHNGRQLIYSDGSQLLHFLDPATGERQHSIAVTENGVPLSCINELEWINGYVWANVWLTHRIVVIDPVSGAVVGSLDLQALLPPQERQSDTDVLNGIAYDQANNALWVTGKLWPWLYQLELSPALPQRAATAPYATTIEYNEPQQPLSCGYLPQTTETTYD